MPVATQAHGRVDSLRPDDEFLSGSDKAKPWLRRRQLQPEARRPLLAALGVAIVVGCAALGAEVATRTDHRSGYLAVATYMPEGAVVTAADLSVVALAGAAGLSVLPSSDAASTIGRRAAEPLAAGSLLAPSDLTAALPLPLDAALVGASLGADQLPASLTTGDRVIVVMAGGSSAPLLGTESTNSPTATSPGSSHDGLPPSDGQNVLALGTVYEISMPQASASAGDEIVTLEVPEADAALVTAASAADDVSLAEVAPQAAG